MQYRGVVCNEEGKLESLPLNRALRDEDGDIYSFFKTPKCCSGNF